MGIGELGTILIVGIVGFVEIFLERFCKYCVRFCKDFASIVFVFVRILQDSCKESIFVKEVSR